MLLPCPHCKKRFQLPPDKIPPGGAKLRCPACKGQFVVDTSPLRRVADLKTEPAPPAPSREEVSLEPPRPAEAGNEAPAERPPQRDKWLSRLWLWIPVSGLLLALMGILAPLVWKAPPASVRQAVRQESPATGNEAPAGAEQAGKEATQKEQAGGLDPDPGQAQQPRTHGPLWPFSPEAKEKTCEYLAQLETLGRGKNRADHLLFYASWIGYLTLETLPSPVCEPENAFRIATDAIAKRELCGRGYAFLAAYYAYKKVPDRARSFLEEGLQASSQPDLWVRLVEGVFCRQVLRDSERAVRILEELLRQDPSFALARYHLARICLEQEQYGKAKDLFRNLEQAFPQQQAFGKIRQSLSNIEDAPYYTAERAKGLLALGRALSSLPDYPLAERICRSVLENLPEDLPKEARKSAFYDLGRISEITGDREMAFTCYQNALRIDPFYRDARERLGSILKGGAKNS